MKEDEPHSQFVACKLIPVVALEIMMNIRTAPKNRRVLPWRHLYTVDIFPVRPRGARCSNPADQCIPGGKGVKHLTVILCSGTDRAAIITTGKKITQLFFILKKMGERAKRGTHIKMVRQRASQAKHTAGHAIFVGMVGGLQGRKVASTYTLPSMYAHLVTLDLSLRRDDIWVGFAYIKRSAVAA